MDSRCRIRVFFDVEATNRIEKATGERVTSYLRSLIYLRSYRFGILPPGDVSSTIHDVQTSRHRDRPELVLYAHDWQRDIGSRNDPLYHEEATCLLSDFSHYPPEGDAGRVQPGYGTPGEEEIWRKQENTTLAFLQTYWETMHSKASPVPEDERLPNRQDMISMLETDMSEVQRRIFRDVRVFGLDPLIELTADEIREVLLQNGVTVIPEDPAPRPTQRRRACRKTTGRKLPRTSVPHLPAGPSVSTSSTQAAAQEVITIKGADVVQTRAEERKPAAHNEAQDSTMSSRRNPVRFSPTARKRKAAEVTFSPDAVRWDAVGGEGEIRVEADLRPNPGLDSTDDGPEPYPIQPVSSPPLGLVTQLPVMSIELAEENSRVSSGHSMSMAQSSGERSTKGNSSLPNQSGNQMDGDLSQGLERANIPPSTLVNRYLWELDDDEDGLPAVDVSPDMTAN